jgi:hypothetical protein
MRVKARASEMERTAPQGSLRPSQRREARVQNAELRMLWLLQSSFWLLPSPDPGSRCALTTGPEAV